MTRLSMRISLTAMLIACGASAFAVEPNAPAASVTTADFTADDASESGIEPVFHRHFPRWKDKHAYVYTPPFLYPIAGQEMYYYCPNGIGGGTPPGFYAYPPPVTGYHGTYPHERYYRGYRYFTYHGTFGYTAERFVEDVFSP